MKNITKFIALILIAVYLSSCATILGGPLTQAQRTKPLKGEPSRQMRAGAFIADFLLGGIIFLGIDFATCAIYKPCGTCVGKTTIK